MIDYIRRPLRYLYNKLNLKHNDESKYNALIRKYHYNRGDSIVKKAGNRVIFMCDGELYHGGLTDRIRGALTTYYLAKRFKMPFFINWISPFKLETYLEPNIYDWRISPEEIDYDIRISTPLVFHTFPPKRYWKRNLLSFYILLQWLAKKGKDKHVYTNFYFPKYRFPILYKELFRPSNILLEEINKHSVILGKNYWSFSFRFHKLLGDFNDVIGEPLSPKAAEELIYKNIKELKALIQDLPQCYKCLITSDSKIFLDKVASIDSRIYIIPGQISHIDVDKSSDNVWLKCFVDQNLIMNAEKVFLLRTGDMYKSGFAEFAALIGEKEFIYHSF